MLNTKKWHWKSLVKEVIKVLLLVFILSNIMSYLRQPELESTQVPKIETELLDGRIFSVEEGKPLLIHFWAVWCPTCKLEAANIEAVSKEYQVLTIAVSSGSDAEVKAYMQEHGLSFKVINDVKGIWAERFKVEAYPTTFMYDAKGELRFTEVGYTSTAGLLARFEWIK
jgi:thiol-disulfide isomerase/thioredoxin